MNFWTLQELYPASDPNGYQEAQVRPSKGFIKVCLLQAKWLLSHHAADATNRPPTVR